MMKPKRLTIDEHREAGLKLKAVHFLLNELLELFDRAYRRGDICPMKTKRLLDDVLKLKSECDSKLFLEYHEKATLAFYYGDTWCLKK